MDLERRKKHSNTDHLPLTKWSVIIPAIHLTIGLFFIMTYRRSLLEIETYKKLLSSYYFMTTFLLPIMYYRQLRDFKIYTIWIVVAIIQVVAYYLTRDNYDFRTFRGTSVDPLKAMLVMLMAFQVIRQLSLAWTKKEFIAMHKGSKWFDKDDNRHMTWVDVLFSFILYGLIIWGAN